MICGLQRPVKNYDPSTFDNELYLISKRSKGYRGGFDDDYEPILGDDVYTPLIKNRVLEIVRAFREKGIISDNELDGISPKKDEPKSFLDKAIDKMIAQALIGTSDSSDSYYLESKVRGLTDQVNKLKEEYYKLDDEKIKLIEKHFKATIDYNKIILSKDYLNYVLIHFLKYCDTEILGSNPFDFKVLLKILEPESIFLLGCLYQDLTVEEYCSLMDKIQGTPPVQVLLDYSTMMKRAETEREYNKSQLFTNLMMFRILKLSSRR